LASGQSLLIAYSTNGAFIPSNRPAILSIQQCKAFSPSDPFQVSGPVYPTIGQSESEVTWTSSSTAVALGLYGVLYANGLDSYTKAAGLFLHGTFIVEAVVEWRDLQQ